MGRDHDEPARDRAHEVSRATGHERETAAMSGPGRRRAPRDKRVAGRTEGPDQPPARFRLVAAVHLFLTRGDEVLLLRRCGTGYEDGNYSVIAGHLDGEEQVKDAAIREAHEEAGVGLEPGDLEVVGVMHRRGERGRTGDERVDFFVAASRWSGEPTNCEPHRCDDLSWFRLDAPPSNVIPYVRRALENYRRGVWFDSFGWE